MQYIEIKAKNEGGDFIGTFKLSVDYDGFVVEEDEKTTLDNSIYNMPFNSTVTLYNVPIVYESDNVTPIQFKKNSENSVNILLLEDKKYFLSFKPSEKFKKEIKRYDIFYSFLKFKESPL